MSLENAPLGYLLDISCARGVFFFERLVQLTHVARIYFVGLPVLQQQLHCSTLFFLCVPLGRESLLDTVADKRVRVCFGEGLYCWRGFFAAGLQLSKLRGDEINAAIGKAQG